MRLDEYDRDEWWDVCRRVRPDLTREQFDAMWAEFLALKARRTTN